MKGISLLTKEGWVIVAAVFVSVMFIVSGVNAASTISTNISTGGTLSVSGLSTVAGYVSTASSTVVGAFTATGAVVHGSTVSNTGLVTNVAGSISQASSTVDGAFTVTGAIVASSTLQVTGATTVYGDATISGGTLTLTHTNTATSSVVVGCIQTYATSTATPIKQTLLASSTSAGTGNSGFVTWAYGTCPLN